MKVDVYEGTINVERGFLADLIGLIKEKSFASFIRDNEVSDDILDFLCEVGTDKIKLAVIYRQNCSLDYFKKILANASLNVKCEIARYENTPLEILEELLKEKVTKLTYAIAQCKNPIMLRKMSKSESDEIRKIVAANEYTPEDIVEDFFQKENDKVLLGLIHNPKIGINRIKEIYFRTDSNWIKRAILKNHTYVTEIVKEQLMEEELDPKYNSFYQEEARSHDTLPEILDLLAKKKADDIFILNDIANNPITSKNTLKELGKGDGYLAYLAKKNKNYPKD